MTLWSEQRKRSAACYFTMWQWWSCFTQVSCNNFCVQQDGVGSASALLFTRGLEEFWMLWVACLCFETFIRGGTIINESFRRLVTGKCCDLCVQQLAYNQKMFIRIFCRNEKPSGRCNILSITLLVVKVFSPSWNTHTGTHTHKPVMTNWLIPPFCFSRLLEAQTRFIWSLTLADLFNKVELWQPVPQGKVTVLLPLMKMSLSKWVTYKNKENSMLSFLWF